MQLPVPLHPALCTPSFHISVASVLLIDYAYHCFELSSFLQEAQWYPCLVQQRQ